MSDKIMYVHADDWARLQKENQELQRQAAEAYQIIRDQIQEIRIISEENGRLKGAADAVLKTATAQYDGEYVDYYVSGAAIDALAEARGESK